MAVCMQQTRLSRQVDDVAALGVRGCLAVALSSLEGDVWDGSVSVLLADGLAPLCEAAVPSTVTAVAWVQGRGVDSDLCVVASCDDGVVRTWRLREAAGATHMEAGPELVEHDGSVAHVASCGSDMQMFATCGSDCSVRVWRVGGRASAATLHMDTPVQHGTWRGTERLAAASLDGSVSLWDPLHSREPLVTARCELPPLCVAPAPSHADVWLVGCDGGSLHALDLRTPGHSVASFKAHSGGVTRLSVCPEGDAVLSAGRDGALRLFSAEGVLRDCALPAAAAVSAAAAAPVGDPAEMAPAGPGATIAAHADYVTAATWLSGSAFASGSWDGSVRTWRLEGGAALKM